MSDQESTSNSNGGPDNGGAEHENGDEEISAREAHIRSLGRDFSQYTSDANFCVYLKFVHDRREIEEDIRGDSYFPDFVHQFFVEAERIFGYKKPIIRLFYTAGRLKRYIKFDYEACLTQDEDHINPDDVMGYLSPILDGIEYTQDLNQFIKEATCKEELEFRPPGDLLYEFESNYKKPRHLSRAHHELLLEAGELNIQLKFNGPEGAAVEGAMAAAKPSGSNSHQQYEDGPPSTKRFQIYHADVDSKNFRDFQTRMQSLVMWFIESANMIDYEDPHWDWFMIFEKYNPATEDGENTPAVSTEDRYYFAGYATVYRYYTYPDKKRPRVSQMLILPQYRRNGLGTTLLQSIYDYYKKQPATLDITAEDPDEDFIAMRDLLDCKNCIQLEAFGADKLREGWTEEMAKEAQEKLKLCRRQARKVYEILRLRITNRSDEEDYRSYRLDIKNRLNVKNQLQKLDVERAVKRCPSVHVPDELKLQDKVIAAQLEDNYRLLEKQYDHIVEKLKRNDIAAA